MSGFFADYGLFLAKTLTIVLALAFLMMLAAANAMKNKRQEKGTLRVERLNDELDELRGTVQAAVADKETLKAERKAKKTEAKAEKKQKKAAKKISSAEEEGKSADVEKKRVYVLSFEGDPKATGLDSLSKCITAVITMAREQDEVILRLESPGGLVHAYGHASAQLARLRERNIFLTICVDKVAASGGYMMACVGNRILASPFAYVGSIGVVLGLPNFNRLLKQHNIDYEMVTAGEFKRTLTYFGENTEQAREKVNEEIQEAHTLFKNFITENRPSLDIETVATGETWFGRQALEKGLIDDIGTSDDCIMEACKEADVYSVKYTVKEPISKKLEALVESTIDSAWLSWMRKGRDRYYS